MVHGEERPSRRQRAHLGPLMGSTPEANELAQWLRERKGDRTLRELESLFDYSRSQWSDFLNGRKLIPLWLLENLVTKLVRPQDRQVQLSVGRHKLEAAQLAAANPKPAGPANAPPQGVPPEIQACLDEARQSHIKAQETVLGLTQLIYIFVSAMADLKQRYETLESERDRMRQQLQQWEESTNGDRAGGAEDEGDPHPSEQRIREAEEHLLRTEQQRAKVEERLTRARRDQRAAEDLRIEALQQAEQYRRAVEQHTGEAVPATSVTGSSELVSLSPSWEDEYFLDVADEQLGSYATRMQEIRAEINPSAAAAPEEPRTVPGQADGTPAVDGAGTASSVQVEAVHGVSTDGVDSSSAQRTSPAPPPGSGPGTGSDSGSVSGTGTVSGPAPARTPGPRGALRSRRVRLALIGTTCLALLAGGGWLAWHQQRPTAEDDARGSSPPGPTRAGHGPAPYTAKDSTTLEGIKHSGGKLRIGVKEDQPGLGMREGGERWGLEIDLAKFVAKELGFGEDQIEFVHTPTESREGMLVSGRVHLILATYSASPSRQRNKEIKFVGAYYTTAQTLLMQKGDRDGEVMAYDSRSGKKISKKINGPSELVPGKTKTCTVRNSTAHELINGEYKEELSPRDPVATYGACVEGLLKGEYAAVITDEVILAGFAQQHPELAITKDVSIGGQQKYKVAMAAGDDALAYVTCKAIEKAKNDGHIDRFYKEHLAEITGSPTPNLPDPECGGLKSSDGPEPPTRG